VGIVGNLCHRLKFLRFSFSFAQRKQTGWQILVCA